MKIDSIPRSNIFELRLFLCIVILIHISYKNWYPLTIGHFPGYRASVMNQMVQLRIQMAHWMQLTMGFSSTSVAEERKTFGAKNYRETWIQNCLYLRHRSILTNWSISFLCTSKEIYHYHIIVLFHSMFYFTCLPSSLSSSNAHCWRTFLKLQSKKKAIKRNKNVGHNL